MQRERAGDARVRTVVGWIGQQLSPQPRPHPDSQSELAREATYPPPYPEGWYVVARSSDVTDKPRFVSIFGQSIAVFRGRSGKPNAVHAYCPHMGANLADGVVDGEVVRCPFHSWSIGGDGCVKELANGEKARANQRTLSWSVDEFHGWVCVYHRHGELTPGPATKPPYHLQQMEEIEDGRLVYRGEHDAGEVRMHLLEFIENSVDFQHFSAIHGRLRVPWTDIPVPGMTVQHEAGWREDEIDRHVAWFDNKAELAFRGKTIPGSGAQATVRLEGPGTVVRFELDLKRGGRVVLFQSHSPVAPLKQRVRFRWYSEQNVPPARASFIVGNWVSQWRRDIDIWERKIFRDKPQLQRSDGPVMQLRRWYAQFYPQSTQSKQSAMQNHGGYLKTNQTRESVAGE